MVVKRRDLRVSRNRHPTHSPYLRIDNPRGSWFCKAVGAARARIRLMPRSWLKTTTKTRLPLKGGGTGYPASPRPPGAPRGSRGPRSADSRGGRANKDFHHVRLQG